MSEEINHYALVVENLHPNISEDRVYSLFSHIGRVKGCMIKRTPRGSTAIVEFEDYQSAATAQVTLNEHVFMERMLKVRWASSGHVNSDDDYDVFVCDSETFGGCRIVRQPQTPQTSPSGDYVLLSFAKKSEATAAITAMNGQEHKSDSNRASWSGKKIPARSERLRHVNNGNPDYGEGLECRVCNEVFTTKGIKVPRLLQCGHTVCHSCLSKLRSSVGRQQIVQCPFDRQPTEVSDESVNTLKKNFALIELLERLEQSNNEKTILMEEERLKSSQACDEDDAHIAVLYCTVCVTHLCENCDAATHSTKTLGKHRRVPLSEKPQEKPNCPVHASHIAEFTCTQEGCHNALMCYICKDYGRHSMHKPALVATEAENIRKSIIAALQKMTQFMESMRDTAHKIEVVIQELEGWAIEDAKQRVRNHFEELRALLAEQEKTALTCVETETRGRLCALKQQQKNLTSTRSQVADVCVQCESLLCSQDWKLLNSVEKVKNVLTTLEQQQQQYAELGPDFLTPESSIPIIFSRDNRVHIGTKIDMRVVMLGLDGAGKTSILSAMRGITLSGPPIPTIGFNVESLEYKNLVFTLWDVGGQKKFRPLWKHYYHNTQAVIFVVDASDRSRFEEAQSELSKVVSERELKDALFLIYANKQDVPECASVEELTEILSLQKLCCGRAWHIQGSSLVSDVGGATQGLDWLTQQLSAHETLYTIPSVSQ